MCTLAGFTDFTAHHNHLQVISNEVPVKLPGFWQRKRNQEPPFQSLHKAITSLVQFGSHPIVEDVFRIIQTCKDAQFLAPARCAHAHICAMGLEAIGMLGNQLVPMFLECGSIEDAERVFLVLLCPHGNTLSALLEEYLEVGESLHALDLFLERQEDIYLEKHLCLMLLKACASIKNVAFLQKIHESIIKEGLEHDTFVIHTLIDVYGKCGFILEAREVFDTLLLRNVVSWTALIGAYANQGFSEEALSSLEQMQHEGLVENVMTFVCALKACANLKALDKGRELHNELIKRSMEKNAFAGNTLIDMYLKCGLFAEAWESFNQLHLRDVFSWTVLIAGCTEHGLNDEALECLERMQAEGVFPNAVTYKCCLKACGKARALDKGQRLHMELAKQGLDEFSTVENTLIDFYGKCGLFLEAKAVFDRMPSHDVVTWNILIGSCADYGLGDELLKCLGGMHLEGISPVTSTFLSCLKACNSSRDLCQGFEIHSLITKMGYLEDLHVGSALVGMYVKCRSLVEARCLFDSFSSQDVALWTALIAAYADEDQSSEALLLYARMQEQGLCPNIVTYVSILQSCGSGGLLRYGRYIHTLTSNLDSPEFIDISLETALMDMYFNCGCMAEAITVFNGASNADLVRWSAFLAGYALYGDQKHVLSLLGTMLKQGIKPDDILLLSILTVCNHFGVADEGLDYLKYLSEMCEISLSIEHFNCLVDLLTRQGRLDEAMAVVKEMPVSPSSTTWNTMVNACKKCGNVSYGRFAFQEMVLNDKERSSAYILMSNMWIDIPHTAGV